MEHQTTRKGVSGTYALPHVARAEWTSYAVSLVPLLVILLYGVFISKRSLSAASFWELTRVGSLISLPMLLLMSGFKIVLHETAIRYRTWSSWPKALAYADMTTVNVATRSGHTYHNWNPAYGMVQMHIGTQANQHALVINMKPFSTRDLAVVVKTIANKTPSVQMDRAAEALRDGDISVTSRQTIRNVIPYLLAVAILAGLIRGLARRWQRQSNSQVLSGESYHPLSWKEDGRRNAH